MRDSEIVLCNALPKNLSKESIVIIDRRLLKKKKIKEWANRHLCISVTAGEGLKNLDSFAKILNKVIEKSQGISMKKLTIVGLGGGSVGDFSGFLASVLKRGVRLVHIPSTWLAAIDSSHGGKTALNAGSYKNQIGSFYSAHKVFLVKSLLLDQPSELAQQGVSELIKMGLISGGKLWANLFNACDLPVQQVLYKNLEDAALAKIKVVKKDPYEQKGLRHVLNLGHTVGHFFEGHFKCSHGHAVGLGLLFALRWSLQKKILTRSWYEKITELCQKYELGNQSFKTVSETIFMNFIGQDKKIFESNRVRFVFVERPGKTPIISVTLKSLVKEARRQGVVE